MEYKKQIERIVGFIRDGEKSKKDLKIGVEMEHIIVQEEDLRSVTYYEEKGIEDILKKLLTKGYHPKYEGQYLIGLEGKEETITLEPGGQLEISIRPCVDLKEIEGIYLNFLQKIVPILEEQNQLLLAIGYHPKSSIQDIPFNPKERYRHMADYFATKGSHAHNMMKGTASLQVVIDYLNEEDFIRKFRVANFLSPLLHLITDNAPIFEGKPYEKNSVRSFIWENTDRDRSSMVEGFLSKFFGYKDYAEYILNTPPIIIMKNGDFINTQGKKAKDIIDPSTITDEELDHILSMVFPDVRVRRYIEIRMGDALPYPLNLGYVALLKGIFYHDISLNYLFEMSKSTEEEKLRLSKISIQEKGYQGRFKCKSVGDFIPILFDLAKQGLNDLEKEYLKPLEVLALAKKNPASVMKEELRREGMMALKKSALNRYGREREDDTKK